MHNCQPEAPTIIASAAGTRPPCSRGIQTWETLNGWTWTSLSLTYFSHHLLLLSRLELNSQDPEGICFIQLSERTQFWPKLSRAFSIYIYRALRIYSIKLIFEGTAGCFPFGWTNIPFHCVPVPHDTVSIFSYWGVLLKPVAAFLHFCAKYFFAKYFFLMQSLIDFQVQ